MSRRIRLVGLLWRWHRRLGLAASALVVLLALSGIALNHTSGLSLDRQRVTSSLVYALYGLAPAAPVGFAVAGGWVSQAGIAEVYLDDTPLARCSGELVGAVKVNEFLAVGCAEELLLFTAEGQLLEALGIAAGLPTPLQALANEDGELVVAAQGEEYRADLDQLLFSVREPQSVQPRYATAETLPEPLARQLPDGVSWLTWERVLLDFHSGRLAGPLGVALVDALGVILCVLGISGFAMWWLHRHRR